jgi:hypothetical protein
MVAGLLVIATLCLLMLTREDVDATTIGAMGALGTVLMGVPLTRGGKP